MANPPRREGSEEAVFATVIESSRCFQVRNACTSTMT